MLNTEKPYKVLSVLKSYLNEVSKTKEKLQIFNGECGKIDNNSHFDVNGKIFYSESKLKSLQSLISYIENNIKGIYAVKSFVKKIPAEYLFFGSGPVERLQAVMIGHRMKDQGKHWSSQGANNMVSLLSGAWNGESAEQAIKELLSDLKSWDDLETRCGIKNNLVEAKSGHKKAESAIGANVYVLSCGKVTPLYNVLKSYAQIRPIIKAIA